MIKKKVKIIEHSMMGDKVLEEYERIFKDETQLNGFLITESEYQNLNRILKVRVELEDI